jgi:dCMP deaminase
MKQKFVLAYMDIAHRIADLSYARRLKVGAVIVKDDVVTYGYNGTPSGWDNNCEDVIAEFETVYSEVINMMRTVELKTKPEVLHAESNAISKIAKSTISAQDADMFITHSPCIDCAKLISQSGIKRVFYSNDYRSQEGIEFLRKSGVSVEQIERSVYTKL